MSVKPDERKRNINTANNNKNNFTYDIENEVKVEESQNSSKEKSEYYNMNLATFTFGVRAGQTLQDEMRESNPRKLNFKKKATEMESNEEYYSSSYLNNKEPSHISTFVNTTGSHHSFLSVVIHSFWQLKHFKTFLLRELPTISEKDSKNRVLYELGQVLLKYPQNTKIDLRRLRTSLADSFQNRRKFLVDQPDDPVDCYFALLNAVHSFTMKSPLNEVVDTMCNPRCQVHRNFWIDLCRIDECECKGNSKRFYSNHNYIFDIPLDKIFELSNNVNLIEMSKSFKLKSGKFSEVGSSEASSITDFKGKLFLYFKMLLNQVKVDCPTKGVRCELNKTHNKTFCLANLPEYLAFSLQTSQINGSTSVWDTLKTFVLVPKLFDLANLFDHSSKQKIFFEFFGAILLKPGKTYTCIFKSPNTSAYNWIHYDDDKISNFSSLFEVISFCVKNLESPVLLFYQIQEKYSDNEKELTNEELALLERYARSADNLPGIVSNRFRSNEDILKFESASVTRTSSQNSQTLQIQNTSKTSTSISTSKNESANNSNSRIDQLTEYVCHHCFTRNRIESPICLKCHKNNEALIEDLLKKRGMNYINIANFNLNINARGLNVPVGEKNKDSYLRPGELDAENNSRNPFIKKINKHDEVDTEEESFGSIRVSGDGQYKNLNMPKQIRTSKKENPVCIKNLSKPDNRENVTSSSSSVKESISQLERNDKQLISRPSKKTISIEEKSYTTCEDRIVPLEVARSKSKKSINTINTIHGDNWTCENCNSLNKSLELKCRDCYCKRNNFISDQNRHVSNVYNTITHNNTTILRPAITNSNQNVRPNSSHHNTIKSQEKKPNTTLERRHTEKKLTLVSTHNNVNHHSQTIKRNYSCACFNGLNDSVIKNNICSVCNRYIESQHENANNLSLKKKPSNQILSNFNNKKSETLTIKANQTSNNNLNANNLNVNNPSNPKFRSPSTVNKPTKSTTVNRYKDIYIETPEEEISSGHFGNPFSVNKIKERDKETINNRSSNNASIRVSSALKKKGETITHYTNNPGPFSKPRK